MHRHLHAAAYYLNPRCHYSPDFSTHPEIKLGLFHCLDKLIPNRDDMEKADLQCSAFHSREGFFGLAQAKNTVYKRTPVEWWTQYGDETPELQKFAVKVLGLTCSSSGYDFNVDVFEGEPSQATQTQPISSSSKKASASAKGSSKGKEKLRLIDEDEWEDIDYDGGSGNKDDEAIDYNDSSDEVSL
nr:uncharacterized protein LOC109165229 [Ipomoea trifida]